MNTFQLITRQIERLRSRTNSSLLRVNGTQADPSNSEPSKHPLPGGSSSDESQGLKNSVNPLKRKVLKSPQASSPVLLFLAIVSLTGVMGVRFYNQPKLAVGREAPETILAPTDATVTDTRTTEERRKEALYGVVPVLVLNSVVNEEINHRIETVLEEGNIVREIAQPFPFVDSGILSTDAQSYLRRIPEWQWKDLLAQVEQTTVQPQLNLNTSGSLSLNGGKFSSAQQQTINQLRWKAFSQLRGYAKQASPQEFAALVVQISTARKRYAKAYATFSKQFPSDTTNFYNQSLLDWSDLTWQQTQVGILQVAKEMLSQGIAPGLPSEILEQAVKIQLETAVPEESQYFAAKLLTSALRTNLIEDREGTRTRAELAAQSVDPVVVTISRGDVIVRQGEKITQREFVMLDHFNKSERGINWKGLLGFTTLVSGAVVVVLFVGGRFRPSLRHRDYLLLLLLTLSTPLLVLLKVPSTGLPAVGLLAGSFYGSAMGATVIGLLSTLIPIGLDVEMIPLLASAAGGILGSLLAGQLRSREELALLGGAVGLTQGTVYLIVTLTVVGTTASSIWFILLRQFVLQVLEGLAWSVVALGLSPYLEHVFDLITPIRLAELANPNRPLLKRLATEAPGTFQHTMFVATLAEAAAQALGCNVELVRTGTLYHDIGKMHDPLGFIENQMGGPNKHDEINDPWESARIIKKHVSEGLAMARRCRLPKAIQAFIPEHQGKMLIAYFYYQAQQRAKEDPSIVVREEDFRYDGPSPQSKETGIVMLADSCEAALRSLKDATHEEALQMVNKILRARWQDHQLVDSGLSREEMAKIAEVFVRVWEQVNHKRIAYPKGVFSAR
ncbi:MAG: HDIG domain-containing protein [Limnoraphis sp. WC205]|jgi:putative nucleotidyltransferase with HDIG domain|nr:HDIG domain-containing protein [Limnoraphis sp. WC205]